MRTWTFSLAVIFAMLFAAQATIATVVINEDFENDTGGSGSTPLSGPHPGTWIAHQIPSADQLTDINHAGSIRGYFSETGSDNFRDGYIKSDLAATTPGSIVTGSFDVKYFDGVAVYGLLSNTNAQASASASYSSTGTGTGRVSVPNAALVLSYSGLGAFLGFFSTDSGGNLIELTPMPADNATFHTLTFQYTVGSSTLDFLKVDGNAITRLDNSSPLIPLHNPGAGIDGMFFSDATRSSSGDVQGTEYALDNLLLNVQQVPEPTALSLVGLGSAVLLGRNLRTRRA